MVERGLANCRGESGDESETSTSEKRKSSPLSQKENMQKSSWIALQNIEINSSGGFTSLWFPSPKPSSTEIEPNQFLLYYSTQKEA